MYKFLLVEGWGIFGDPNCALAMYMYMYRPNMIMFTGDVIHVAVIDHEQYRLLSLPLFLLCKVRLAGMPEALKRASTVYIILCMR